MQSKYIRYLPIMYILQPLYSHPKRRCGVGLQETISLIVLVEFPLELIFAVLAGHWAAKGRPFTPWLTGYYLRLAMAVITTGLVAVFPLGATLSSAPLFYAGVVGAGIANSFASTIMFVSQVCCCCCCYVEREINKGMGIKKYFFVSFGTCE